MLHRKGSSPPVSSACIIRMRAEYLHASEKAAFESLEQVASLLKAPFWQEASKLRFQTQKTTRADENGAWKDLCRIVEASLDLQEPWWCKVLMDQRAAAIRIPVKPNCASSIAARHPSNRNKSLHWSFLLVSSTAKVGQERIKALEPGGTLVLGSHLVQDPRYDLYSLKRCALIVVIEPVQRHHHHDGARYSFMSLESQESAEQGKVLVEGHFIRAKLPFRHKGGAKLVSQEPERTERRMDGVCRVVTGESSLDPWCKVIIDQRKTNGKPYD